MSSKPLIQFTKEKKINLLRENYTSEEVASIINLFFISGAMDWAKLEKYLSDRNGTIH